MAGFNLFKYKRNKSGSSLSNASTGDQVHGTFDTGQEDFGGTGRAIDSVTSQGYKDLLAKIRGGIQESEDLIGKPEYIREDSGFQDILARKKDLSYGLNAQEMQGMRDASNMQINRALTTGQRQTAAAQAANGMRGAAATRQMADLNRAASDKKVNFERDLMLNNIALKRAGLSDYSNTYENSFTDDRTAKSIYDRNKLNFGMSAAQLYNLSLGNDAAVNSINSSAAAANQAI